MQSPRSIDALDTGRAHWVLLHDAGIAVVVPCDATHAVRVRLLPPDSAAVDQQSAIAEDLTTGAAGTAKAHPASDQFDLVWDGLSLRRCAPSAIDLHPPQGDIIPAPPLWPTAVGDRVLVGLGKRVMAVSSDSAVEFLPDGRVALFLDGQSSHGFTCLRPDGTLTFGGGVEVSDDEIVSEPGHKTLLEAAGGFDASVRQMARAQPPRPRPRRERRLLRAQLDGLADLADLDGLDDDDSLYDSDDSFGFERRRRRRRRNCVIS
mmetsp:Transcript_48512/g.105204  ORF Transcript_48512/g.105204 Transcript_48512/m.105204 type:complete len:262 (-) Transcript_48512:43-828(-)